MIEHTSRGPGLGWLMRGASLAQASNEYIDHWKGVYRGYEEENRRFKEAFAQRVPGVPTRAAEKEAYDKWAAANAAAIREASDRAAAERAAQALLAPAPPRDRVAEEWNAVPLPQWAGRLSAMSLSDRVVLLARYLVWKTAAGQGGDVMARTAKAQLDVAQRQITRASEIRPEWHQGREIARELDRAVSAFDETEERAKRAVPKDKTALYTALAREMQAANKAKTDLYNWSRGKFVSDEEVDRFAKWALPRTRLLLRLWLTPGPWRTTINPPPAFVAPPPPQPAGAQAPPSAAPLPYAPGYYGAPAQGATTTSSVATPATATPAPSGVVLPGLALQPAGGIGFPLPFGSGIYRT